MQQSPELDSHSGRNSEQGVEGGFAHLFFDVAYHLLGKLRFFGQLIEGKIQPQPFSPEQLGYFGVDSLDALFLRHPSQYHPIA